MQEAFSLLAYAEPWKSPVGGQLDPAGREPICDALNSAILGTDDIPYGVLRLIKFRHLNSATLGTNVLYVGRKIKLIDGSAKCRHLYSAILSTI